MEESEREDLAKATIQRLQSAMQAGTFVGMPEVVRLIQELSTKAFSVTLMELAEIIEQDVSITARVIGSANTMKYNPTCVPVSTVSQAIQLVGFERVRNLAMSLLLAENAAQPLTTDEQRETAAFALSSGLFAQAIMERRGGDAELAFVTTALRSYGRLMMTAFMIDEYRDAMDLAQEAGEDEAFREVFGLTALELSHALLQTYKLPKEILRILQKLPLSMSQLSTRNKEDVMFVLADFSVRVCELAMDVTLDAGQFKNKADGICRSYSNSFHFDKNEVQEAFKDALNHYDTFGSTYGIRRPKNNTIRLVAARSEALDPPDDIESGEVARRRAQAGSKPVRGLRGRGFTKVADVAARQVVDADILAKSIERIKKLTSAETPPLDAIHNEVASSFTLALSLGGGILLRLDGKGCFRVVAQSGSATTSLRSSIEGISKDSKDVFGICLSRREDVLIEDVRIGNAARYLPVWLKLNSPVMSLILLPVMDEGVVKGLIFGLRCRGEPLGMNPPTLQALRTLRGYIAEAWRKGK